MMEGMLEGLDGGGQLGGETRIRIGMNMLGLTKKQMLPKNQELLVYAIVLVLSLVKEKKSRRL